LLKHHRAQIEELAAGSVQRNLYISVLGGLPVKAPELPEQKRIAALLGNLDDKIELNRRMNATLEALARALFQSWFVDFDPVRAKAEGRPPAGMDAATAALFPDRFEDSALGEVPQGWRYGQLSELAHITMGQSPPGDTYNETGEGLPFYQGTRDFGFRFPSQRVYCSAPTRYADAGDVLLSVRAPVGNLNVATEKCAIGRGVAGLTSAHGAPSFLFHAMLNSQAGWQKFEAEGTVFGSVSKNDVHNFSALIPPDELIQSFETIAAPLDKCVLANENESQTLAELRDTLLPKLMSGAVRVR
jgi:type I restriction enzyme S subunit